MIWKRKDGREAPKEAVEAAERGAAEFHVPVGLLLASCEEESDFRLGLISPAGAVGPMQFLAKYKEDYWRYAGFAFELEGWDALRGAAAVFAWYASLGQKRHGLKGEDAWRFAASAHRYGQNSPRCLQRDNSRVQAVESHMRRNGLWYGETTCAADVAAAAAAWAEGKCGCRYSQAEREAENAFDCSSLIARAYAAQGVEWGCAGAPCPNSSQMAYDDQFRLLWPEDYASIGRKLGGREALALAKKPGDIQLLCTQRDTARANRVTHAAMVLNENSIVHARGSRYGVRTDERELYTGKVCALLRYDPAAPCARGCAARR